jgi:hypothetical protein
MLRKSYLLLRICLLRTKLSSVGIKFYGSNSEQIAPVLTPEREGSLLKQPKTLGEDARED